MNERPSNNGAFIAKLGAWLQLAQIIGLAGTVTGMMKAFKTLEASGAGDPAKLSAAIGDVLVYTATGIALSFIGLVLMIIAITVCGYRSRWMFQFLCFYGLFVIGLNICLLIFGHFALSLHLPFGLFFLIFAQVKKDEFMQAAAVKRKLPSCYKLDP
ncbi:MAG: MotA/TolQ/ExbB proton channel family protein [Prosthecobacter sp.]|uniref:MotA/TolQ/ExbB proton channel family protein n=1 Tax=Prosthecobacter sp. TaxID=1965333 RepID=UPI0038FE0550